MSSNPNRSLAPQPRKKKLIEIFADRYSVDPYKVMETLKTTCFKQKEGITITDDQMMALLIVANEYHLNPFTKEIYAFPDKGGIVPIVGLDGWARLMNENPNFNGIEFEMSDDWTTIDDHHKPCPESITCVIYRKDRDHPIRVVEYLDEVYRPPFIGNKGRQDEYTSMGPWQTHTKRMLRWKAMIQGGRVAFSFAGIYDQDEAERIIEGNFTVEGVSVEAIEDKSPQTATSKLKDRLGMKTASEIEQPEPKKNNGEDTPTVSEAVEAEDANTDTGGYNAESVEQEIVDPETGEVITEYPTDEKSEVEDDGAKK